MTGVLGLCAGLLTTVCWIPQLLRSLRTRSTDDLSWTYLAALATGVALWLSYGLLRADLAVIGANLVTLGFLVTLIVIKSRTRRSPAASADAGS